MSSVRKVVYMFVLFTVYILVFGAIMYAVERTEDDQQVDKHVILQNLWMNVQRKYNMTREEFDNITRVIHQSQVMGREPWTYTRGVRFAFVTCTTIGYGDITPKTEGGMMLCIIGALLGIPLTLLTLNSIGAMVTEGCTKIIQSIETRLLKHTSVESIEIKRFFFIIVLMTFMIIFGAAIGTQVTDWSFTGSVYFWFITFSTIGFGDYVPPNSVAGSKPGTLALASTGHIIFTLFGLAILASGISCALEISKYGISCLRCQRPTGGAQVENTEKDFQPRDKEKNCITA